ncbi:SGNH/GDSL hydrolase family protein [Paenibacillus sp. Marseille-Q4541]|uniref:SGNH/GDSL hydrolase family protein n=1 Tax=Paenibacillus sp. Marseille-Q4541 TaxID=2831522 RepID=UPI001BA81998|nr:SGNH/GDSL hydrolase family protein [Paenibacillus sp. Marseille-Q4541]
MDVLGASALNKVNSLNTMLNSKNFLFDSTKSKDLSLYFGPGKLRLADGTFLKYGGGAVNVPPSTPCEIMLDLYDNKLHALPRAIHRGAIHIASVQTNASSFTSVEQPDVFLIPTSRIEKTKRKIKRKGQVVRVELLGDSLTQGAGDTPYWRSIIFDSTNSALGYSLSRLTDITIDNYAVGSQTSRYGFAVTGRKVYTSNAQYDNTSVTLGEYINNVYINPPKPAASSPVASTQYDLAIVSFGANGGTNYLSYLENIIKELRTNDVEVILTSSNFSRDDSNFLYDDTKLMRDMADVWGCEFADTWAYVREAQWNGDNVHADSIHMSTKGHIAWAKAIRSTLNDIYQEPELTNPHTQTRIMPVSDSGLYSKFPNACEIVFDPFAKTGTTEGGTSTVASFNPALLFGGKLTTNYLQTVSQGQNVQYGHAHAHAVDIIYEYSSAFTANVTRNGDAIAVKTISHSTIHPTRIGLIEVADLGVWGDASNGKPGYRNAGIKINCTSGTMKIVGVVFHTWKNRELRFDEIKYTGTWLEEPWMWNVPYTKYTDTNGDSFDFEFLGTGAQLLFSNKSASGKVDVYLDGVKVITGKDLYSANNNVASVDLFPYSSINRFDIGYGKHYVKVVFNGLNTSATESLETNRRIQFLGGYIFDSR